MHLGLYESDKLRMDGGCMPYTIKRIEPNDGDGITRALMLSTVKLVADQAPEVGHTTSPVVGSQLLAESFSEWFWTTEVTEIVSETPHADHVEIIFKTTNSTYSLEKY
jgi:hypothetical protein